MAARDEAIDAGYRKLSKGMTEKQVLEILGEPNSRKKRKDQNIWIYPLSMMADTWTDRNHSCTIYLKGGIVIAKHWNYICIPPGSSWP